MDLVVFVAEPQAINRDRDILESFKELDKPVILLLNKIDKIKKPEILSHIDEYRNLFAFKEIIPVSAIKYDGIELFLKKVLEYLPYGPKY
jgi:GTP-binding protein Era